ncbi:hypothetical protein X765_32270 [Mesorhizobium sp. LSHC440B00]|nr:hypothetical protein X765_32270 [Mesorhizobium sp. LSHC440B00]ESX29170.1 hypothetical protein X764_32035 [Mesorhizobium sp. LSHC440A00]
MITDLQSEHFVDEKGALFPDALFYCVTVRLEQARWIGFIRQIFNE